MLTATLFVYKKAGTWLVRGYHIRVTVQSVQVKRDLHTSRIVEYLCVSRSKRRDFRLSVHIDMTPVTSTIIRQFQNRLLKFFYLVIYLVWQHQSC